MKKSIVYLGILSVALIFTSCGGDEAKTEEAAQEQACFYKYNSGSTVLEWTAFKFTEKAPVKGTFNEITYEGKESSDDLEDLVKSMSFSIQTASVETQNEERNGKIAKLFFETIGTPVIKAKVLKLENGKATLEIMMNELSKEVTGEYKLEDNKFSFTGTIDVANWNGMKGIETLNAACKDLHTGADGKSKLWSEVDLSFTTEFSSDCE